MYMIMQRTAQPVLGAGRYSCLFIAAGLERFGLQAACVHMSLSVQVLNDGNQKSD